MLKLKVHFKCNGNGGLVDCGFWEDADVKKVKEAKKVKDADVKTKTMEFTINNEVITLMSLDLLSFKTLNHL